MIILINKSQLIEQVLYVDFAGGKFESWFYSEGEKYRMFEAYEFAPVKRWAISQDFTKIVLTAEAGELLK